MQSNLNSNASPMLIPKSGSMDHIRKNHQMIHQKTHQRTSSNNDCVSSYHNQNFSNKLSIGGLREKIEEKLNEQLGPGHNHGVYIKNSQ